MLTVIIKSFVMLNATFKFIMLDAVASMLQFL